MAQPSDFASELPKGPGSKIVRAKDQPAWTEGYRFLEEAKRGHAEERQRGYAEGKAAGAQEAAQLLAATAAKVDSYIAGLDGQIAGLALDIVKRILGEFDEKELVAHAAATALADFRREKALKLAVHPSAEAYVRDIVARRLPRAGLTVTVEGDPALGLTDCLLSSEFAVVNASIETQLRTIARVLGLGEEIRFP